MRRSGGVTAAASSAGCERSHAARWKRLLLRRGLAVRPTPSTVNPRSSIAAASASPRPRETPVTIAACMRSSSGFDQRAPNDSTIQKNDEDRDHEQRDFPRALRILAANRAGDAVHRALEHAGAVRVRKQPHRRENVLERLLPNSPRRRRDCGTCRRGPAARIASAISRPSRRAPAPRRRRGRSGSARRSSPPRSRDRRASTRSSETARSRASSAGCTPTDAQTRSSSKKCCTRPAAGSQRTCAPGASALRPFCS